MPALAPHELVSILLDAIQESGTSAIIVSAPRAHPRRFIVAGEHPLEVWIYAWTLTHGGRPQLPDEFRIQLTSVQSPLDLNPNGPTILIGYDPNLNVFAGFDLERHQHFTGGSPSVQIDVRALRQAVQDGFGFDRKGNAEIAVGFRPDQLVNYMETARDLHRQGRSSRVLGLLQRAASMNRVPAATISSLPARRKKFLQKMMRFARDAKFRRQVLGAYEHRCAVTRAQLQLLDAAHILPVGAAGSTDDVRNGMSLSPTYHRAYDARLIFLDETYVMKINPARENELVGLRLAGGLKSFKAALGKIHLPQDREQWPDVSMIRRANQVRRVPGR